MTDMQYIDRGAWIRLTNPVGEEAIDAYKKISEVFPGCDIPLTAWNSVRKQLRDAGYKVRIFRPEKFTGKDEDELNRLLDLWEKENKTS